MDKRTFIKTSSLIGLGSFAGFEALGKLMKSVSNIPSKELATNDDFWLKVRGDYDLTTDYINLENGYYCIQPKPVLDAFINHVKDINRQGAHYMRTVQVENKNKMAAKLAEMAGCSKDELIITRNTTESLDMIISGMKWNPGDEAIMAVHDYGAMIDMFGQVSKRYGMVNRILTVPMNPKSDDEIVELYANAITPKTKLLMICHMINITGQILPVRKICDMAHSKGVPVMVDGAHAFAHISFKISDLNCDYYGCSLHKWLSVPLGAGFLYVKKENISKIWSLFAEGAYKEDDIARLNHTGTSPVFTDLSISDAIDYYNIIGAQRKEERLRYLQNYWTGKVRGFKNIILNTPEDPTRSCAIANVGIKNMKAGDMADTLLKKYKIYTVSIDNKGVVGCRITPNVFTTTEELDALVVALKEMCG